MHFLSLVVEPGLHGRPALVRGASKYSGYTTDSVGWFGVWSFPGLECLPAEIQEAAVQACNNSVSKKTWGTYNAVKTHLDMCERKIGRSFRLPMDESSLVIFVAYLLSTGKLKAESVGNILSALRMYHLSQGFYSPMLRPDCIKNLLKGRGNQDALEERDKPSRLPVTLGVLELLRLRLKRDKNMSEEEKSVVWAVSTVAFGGGFRVGELLSKKARTIDPSFDLQKGDIKHITSMVEGQTREILVVMLKCPKETRQNKVPIRVEVFGNNTRQGAIFLSIRE